MKCQHCNELPVSRPRRLCWSCYYTPGVRERYPSTSKFGRRGIGNFNGTPPLPAFATGALPGTAAKLAVLEERARQRLNLWHPADATFVPSVESDHAILPMPTSSSPVLSAAS
jgi:hypothetical protein